MADGGVWPPASARQALLSSPSGRQKYADYMSGLAPSPIKRSATTISLVDRVQLASEIPHHRIPSRIENDDEDEDDEETLQLKLAAIEAKLKLKKLQNRAAKEDELRLQSTPRLTTEIHPIRPASPTRVDVEVSPSKRRVIEEQRSPNRVRLGIDKGVKGSDISLQRSKSVTKPRPHEGYRSLDSSRSTSRQSKICTLRAAEGSKVASKTFNERMSTTRDSEHEQAEKRAILLKRRSGGLRLDEKELEQYKALATRSAFGDSSALLTATSDKENNIKAVPSSPRRLHKSRTLPNLHTEPSEEQGDPTLFEGFSGLHLTSRILPHSFLKRNLPADKFTIYRVPDVLKHVTSPAFELPEDVGDFVVFGIIASKSNPLDQKAHIDEKSQSSDEWKKKWDDGSQNTKKFMVLTVTDLKWTINLYLFETAVPRYHRLSPGTVVAIANPSIMPPKRGKEDTGAFSLALHNSEDTILEIGTSLHLSYCNAKKKDGAECGTWVDGSKTQICEWHLNAQVARTQSSRMGVNAGANGIVHTHSRWGNNTGSAFKHSSIKEGRGYDAFTGSQYYISASTKKTGLIGSGPLHQPDISTAEMIDCDDPFIAEGKLSRDTKDRIRKRVAAQRKERQIADKLSKLGDGTSAGADYMARKADGDASLKPREGRRQQDPPGKHNTDQHSPAKPALTGIDFRAAVGRKRPAQDVSLSPVKAKKTRFMTSTGIKEAGRESVGIARDGYKGRFLADGDTDDDDLDIV